MDQTVSPQPLLVEKAAAWGMRQFKENKLPLLSAILFGLLAYTFAFTNKLVNHDEVGQLFGKGATVSSGRWGLGALDSIFPNYSMPWIYGIITILLIAVAICIIIRIFAIRHKLLQVLMAGSIMVFPSLIGLFGYMFTSASYAVSFLLAVLAVWCLQRPSKLFILPAMGCMIFSLSIYQSYLSIAVSLLVLILIQRLLTEENALPILRQGILYVIFLVVSLALYYAATQVVLRIKGISFNDYASDSITLSLSTILDGIVLAYVNFIRFFTWAHHRLMPTSLSRWVHLMLFLSIAVLMLVWMIRQKPKAFRLVLLILLLAILPLAINCMYMITAEGSIHTLVLYSFVAVYILGALTADHMLTICVGIRFFELVRRAALNFVVATLSVIIIVNTYVANASYLNMHLRYENSYAFYTSLMADLKMMPEFTPETKIAMIGSWDAPDFYEYNLEFTHYLVGVTGFSPNTYSQQAFMEYYLGFPISFASGEEIAVISESPEFTEMATYPYYGSMKIIDNILVVKLS